MSIALPALRTRMSILLGSAWLAADARQSWRSRVECAVTGGMLPWQTRVCSPATPHSTQSYVSIRNLIACAWVDGPAYQI